MSEAMSVFETLNKIDVSKYIEKKNGLSYLSWAWAWGKLKENYPDATYTIYEDANGRNYHTDGKTCWVKTGVTVRGIENIEYLPVMDYKNASISVDKVTSFDVNKAIQRSLTKAVARHGLGLYIYAGEDLPEEAKQAGKTEPQYEDPMDAPFEPAPTLKQKIEAKKATQEAAPPWDDLKVTPEDINHYFGEFSDEGKARVCKKFGLATLADMTYSQLDEYKRMIAEAKAKKA